MFAQPRGLLTGKFRLMTSLPGRPLIVRAGFLRELERFRLSIVIKPVRSAPKIPPRVLA